jgi:Ras GTPase-activating protein 3
MLAGTLQATKCTDQFMKITGLPYLHSTLKEEIDRIFVEKKDCEIDPTKLPPWIVKKGDISKHAEFLNMYLERIVDKIFTSVERCPAVMRRVFKHLQENTRKNAAVMKAGGTSFVCVFFLAVRQW